MREKCGTKAREVTLMAKVRQTTCEERLEIVNYYLDNGADCLKVIRKYGVSYGQIYSWINKYRQYGAAGLQDRRGTGRSLGEADELGETERLRVENRLLRASIKNLKEERHVLKKHLSYLERRIAGGQAGDEGRSA